MLKKILVSAVMFWGVNAFAQKNDFSEFIPKNYKLFEKVSGDLNKDGKKDIVLIIKKIDKKNIVKNETNGEPVDRNRRGIIVLLNKGKNYEILTQNLACFSSENEFGGIYFPPELSPEIKKNSLFIGYSHGRYGFWHYQFRILENDMQLIGYERDNYDGPWLKDITSINFLTQKKRFSKNTATDEKEDAPMEETWSNISVKKPILLSEIKDFDNLNF